MATKRAEDELGGKLDRCVADTLLKTVGGVAIGLVVSVAVFRGRAAPVWVGTGIGIGAGWANCRHDLQAPYALHGRKVADEKAEPGKAAYKIVVDAANKA